MKNEVFSKTETVVGVFVLLAVVLGFILSVVLALPKSAEVERLAAPIKKEEIDKNFFTDKNEVTQKLNQLKAPAGVPVIIDPANLGRGNAFQKP